MDNNTSERQQYNQQATIGHADMAKPERGRVHVQVNIHPLVSLIITVVVALILVVSWSVYAIYHQKDFIASTVELFHDGTWLIKVVAILLLLWLAVYVVGHFIERVIHPLIHALHLFFTAIGQLRRNKVLAMHENYTVLDDGNPQFYQVAQDRTTYNLKGETPKLLDMPAGKPLMLPDKVLMLDVMRKWDLRPDNLLLALGKGGQELACSIEGLMHVAHDSPTGGGKTAQFYAELIMLLRLDTQVILANPHFAPVGKGGDDWRPIAKAIEAQGKIEIAPGMSVPGLIRKYQNIAYMLQWLSTVEVDRRFDMQARGDYSYQPLYVFIDEWASVVRRFPEAASYLVDVLQRGRAVEVNIDTNAQGFLAEDTELKGSARENYNTAFHMGGSVYSGSKLLDMPVKDMNALLKNEQVTLGKGIALLRNNEAIPQAQLVRLPYAENNYCYYYLGRANDWILPELRTGRPVSTMETDTETLETAIEADAKIVNGAFPVSSGNNDLSVNMDTSSVSPETRETIRRLYNQSKPHREIAAIVGLSGRNYKTLYKPVCRELGIAIS